MEERIYKPGDLIEHLQVVELLATGTGHLPTHVPAARLLELMKEIRDVVPPSPRELNPEAPPALSGLAMRCLAKRAKDRPASGTELLWRVNAALYDDREFLGGLAPEYRAGEGMPVADLTERWAPPSDAAVQGAPAPAPTQPSRPAPRTAISFARRFGYGAALIGALFVAGVAAVGWRLEALHGRDLFQLLHEKYQADAETSARDAVARQVPGTMPPHLPPTEFVLKGLKMPDKDKMSPRWLRPGPDGICRHPITGERAGIVAILRGVCFEVGTRVGKSCPPDWFDPPPEVFSDPSLARFRNKCFAPYLDPGEGRSATP